MCTTVCNVAYEVVRRIGNGGFGNVYLLRRTDDAEEVAAKVIEEEEWLPIDEEEEPETTVSAMAMRELAYLTLLTKAMAPRITPLLDFAFSLDDVCALVLIMPLYAGDLAGAIKTKDLSPRQRLAVAGDLLEALAFLHALTPTIVHRDVKPENIFLDGQRRGHLGDFGLASFGCETPVAPEKPTAAVRPTRRRRKRSVSPFHSGPVGTETYIAPEAVDVGGLAHPSLDLWSAGVVLWELWDNERLDADTDTTAIRRLRRWRADLKGKLPGYIKALLADEPQNRAPAATILAELRRLKLHPPSDGKRRPPDLRTPALEPSAEVAAACKTLRSKVAQSTQAAQRYRELAPDVDVRALAALSCKLYEHRPPSDCEIMEAFGLDPYMAIDAFEETQEALLTRFRGHLLTVASALELPPCHGVTEALV